MSGQPPSPLRRTHEIETFAQEQAFEYERQQAARAHTHRLMARTKPSSPLRRPQPPPPCIGEQDTNALVLVAQQHVWMIKGLALSRFVCGLLTEQGNSVTLDGIAEIQTLFVRSDVAAMYSSSGCAGDRVSLAAFVATLEPSSDGITKYANRMHVPDGVRVAQILTVPL